MTNTLPPISPDARLSNGYGLPASDRAEQVIRKVDQSIARRAAERTKKIKSIGRAAALSGAVVVGAIGAEVLDSDSKPKAPVSADAESTTTTTEPNTALYTVQPGDTAWDIAKKIQLNTGEHDDIRPLVDDLQGQSEADGDPGLQVGEKLQVPKAADVYADIPSAQLDHK